MNIDINVLRGLSTILVMIAFLGVCVWAYSSKRKDEFTQAALMPFADDEEKETRE
jgi:cytochrome c oxidase cbb3-type subunit 4